jgi:hypothetical protein
VISLRERVERPALVPWIPPPPELAFDTPVILPNLATLERVRDALRVARPKPPRPSPGPHAGDGRGFHPAYRGVTHVTEETQSCPACGGGNPDCASCGGSGTVD